MNVKFWFTSCLVFIKLYLIRIFRSTKSLLRIYPSVLKFRYSEKATKCRKNLPIFLTLLGNVKYDGRFFSNFVAFSEYLNFKAKSFRGIRRNLKSTRLIEKISHKYLLYCNKYSYVNETRLCLRNLKNILTNL